MKREEREEEESERNYRKKTQRKMRKRIGCSCVFVYGRLHICMGVSKSVSVCPGLPRYIIVFSDVRIYWRVYVCMHVCMLLSLLSIYRKPYDVEVVK